MVYLSLCCTRVYIAFPWTIGKNNNKKNESETRMPKRRCRTPRSVWRWTLPGPRAIRDWARHSFVSASTRQPQRRTRRVSEWVSEWARPSCLFYFIFIFFTIDTTALPLGVLFVAVVRVTRVGVVKVWAVCSWRGSSDETTRWFFFFCVFL